MPTWDLFVLQNPHPARRQDRRTATPACFSVYNPHPSQRWDRREATTECFSSTECLQPHGKHRCEQRPKPYVLRRRPLAKIPNRCIGEIARRPHRALVRDDVCSLDWKRDCPPHPETFVQPQSPPETTPQPSRRLDRREGIPACWLLSMCGQRLLPVYWHPVGFAVVGDIMGIRVEHELVKVLTTTNYSQICSVDICIQACFW